MPRSGKLVLRWCESSEATTSWRIPMADLKRAGFVDRGGKGDHRNFVHPKVTKPVTVSGAEGDDAKQYQERAVRRAIEESHK